MLYKSPQYMDDLILSETVRGRGLTPDYSGLAAAHNAKQAAARNEVESKSKRLAENKRQFDTRLGLAKKDFEDSKDRADRAMGISKIGLLTSIGGGLYDRHLTKQRNKKIQSMISEYDKMGTMESSFYADMLRSMIK